MTDETDTDPADARRKVALEAQMAARSAVLHVAGQIGAEIRERPVWRTQAVQVVALAERCNNRYQGSHHNARPPVEPTMIIR